MRSKEVAELAGVSVRTLRHYHQVGVLPEPGRGTNGYRTYELSHVARLLRIRTLAELGVPLERMAALLDDPADTASADLLADLETQLRERIAHLEGQLRRVSELRTSRARPDLTPALAEFLAAVGGVEESGLADLEHDASVLLARLYEAGGTPEDLHELAAVLNDVRSRGEYDDFAARFEALPADASEADVRGVADAFIAAFGPMLTQHADTAMGGRLRQLREQDVPAVDLDPRLNDAQAAVLRLIGDTL
ncbi:DNA-binding transcriptional regulator, MerR family [Nocardioides exalbidus]|uniref:DNA-binding transcriptional regulator, MerR family n=1 Tax=Nocardioides exalbidus TaxID=402596 RepID=A0A1H4KPB9_9ACTN|nr:MerR family transcriptional regulator [Nocardioides exalbidus]SEB60331.1 DNA-binding transcriptional regulator, MerR family [Nocardioides exalbidus]